MNEFEIDMINKITNGEKLSKNELRDLVEFEIDRIEGDDRRWSRTITSICELDGRYFKLVWEHGLTEMQENEYYNQPYEVKKHTYEKTITVTEWIKI